MSGRSEVSEGEKWVRGGEYGVRLSERSENEGGGGDSR